MNIRGIGPIQSVQGGKIETTNKSINSSHEDRDAQREEQEERRKRIKLTDEQVLEAFKALVTSLSGSGLRASQDRENDLPVFRVFDQTGKEIRTIRYPRIVELYLKRNEEQPGGSGTLLRKSA